MSVAYELKQKRAALTDRLQLERERADIQELMRALDRVILSYEPDYQGSSLTGPEQGNRSRKAKQSSSEVKAAMNGVNKRQAVLKILREAGEPISVTDCAVKFAAKIGIPSEPANLSDIAYRLSAVLTQLTTAGRVRQSGQFDGRKVLWEVAALPSQIRSGGLLPCQYPHR
ncbi:hypothetical protein J8N08_24640 (plasmid) [Agrobacterium tumefaciens]|uniref:hypothetical protein n=1 Tax=Agrobacterium tumefaciens TaxID=358 RepID=UPI000DCF8926|nr:hypothetical protein J8N08_24640 [Agrobacterium tumefaciens]